MRLCDQLFTEWLLPALNCCIHALYGITINSSTAPVRCTAVHTATLDVLVTANGNYGIYELPYMEYI